MSATQDGKPPNASRRLAVADVNWERLDKARFFGVGAGVFSVVSALLYPMSVIKTNLQVAARNADGSGPSTWRTVQAIARADGIRGFYKGFGTVVTGMLPARVVYLSSLEVVKDGLARVAHGLSLDETLVAGVSSGGGALVASTLSQGVLVPVDVISQRLMVQGQQARQAAASTAAGGQVLAPQPHYTGGWHAFQSILRNDGVRGLYRGFGASIVTYAPSSAIWWGSYGASQSQIWRILHRKQEKDASIYSREDGAAGPPVWMVTGVQVLSGLCAGTAAAITTTPLDVVKTRLQVLDVAPGSGPPTFWGTITRLVREEGLRGFTRGFLPRWFNISLWGTSMVTTYEFLKRYSVKEDT
eukprot:jgi/Mesvir1/10751/Mv13820-RA.1